MKEQILTLERTDDLSSLRDKIMRAQAGRLFLIWEAFDEPLTRRLDMVLLDRWAALAGSELTVISADDRVRRLAQNAGIRCFPTLARAALAGLSPNPRTSPTKTQLRFRRPVAARPPAARGRALPPAARIAVFGAAVCSIAAVFLLLIPSARIRVAFAARAVSASAELAPSDCSDLSTASTLSDRRPTTGRVLAPATFATGGLSLTNVSKRMLDLPAGLRAASADGVAFETVAGLALAPGETKSVAIRALEAGPAGNLGPGKITRILGPLSLSLAATNPQPTAGGTAAWRSAVSAADLAGLEAGLTDRIRQAALDRLRELAGANRTLVEDSLTIETDPQDQPDAALNAPADTVGLTLHALASVRTCPAGWIRSRAAELLSARLEPGESLAADSVAVRLDQTAGGSVRLSAAGNALRIPDRNEMALALRAQTPGRAAEILRGRFHAQAMITCDRTPGWLPLLPLFPVQIEIFAEAG
jgi:hypothetical protein